MSLSSVVASGSMYHARGTVTDDTSATAASAGRIASAAPALKKSTKQEFDTFSRDVQEILERMKHCISAASFRTSLSHMHMDDDKSHATLQYSYLHLISPYSHSAMLCAASLEGWSSSIAGPTRVGCRGDGDVVDCRADGASLPANHDMVAEQDAAPKADQLEEAAPPPALTCVRALRLGLMYQSYFYPALKGRNLMCVFFWLKFYIYHT